jgi:NitT/TauT family transport system permease protein
MTEATEDIPARAAGRKRPPPLAGSNWMWMRYPLVSVLAVLILFAAWALATDLLRISPMTLPSPRLMAKSFQTMLVEGYSGKTLWEHILASLWRTLTGLLAGIACGVPIGLMMGYSRIVNAALMPGFGFIRPIPPIAFIPLVILWFGIGEFSKILLIFVASFNYTVLASAAGMRSVPDQLIRAGTNLGLTRWQLFSNVMLPAAMPHIFTGIKISIAVSWAVVVAAELIAAQAGLGYIISDAGTFFRTPEVLIGVFVIGAIGLLFEIIITTVERRVLHWQSKA